MPFPFVPTASPLTLRPLVTVTFSGQMLLQPGAADTQDVRTCEIGINRFAREHLLNVLLIIHRPNVPPAVIHLARGPLTDDFLIRVVSNLNQPLPGDFRVFAPTPEPFQRSGSVGNSDFDYRWAVNLKSPNVHPNATRNRNAEPIVKLTSGTLYSPHLTHEDLNPDLFRPHDSTLIPLFKIAPQLAASITPPANTRVQLEWRDLGDPVVRSLPRATDPAGTIYTVSFVNDPLVNIPTHEELALYYKVLDVAGVPIPDPERFVFRFDPAIGSDLIPCLPIVLNPS